MRPVDLTGKMFGRLTVVCQVTRIGKKQKFWECLCECGNQHIVAGTVLRLGNSKSCGCLRREMMREAAKTRNLRHGEGSNGKESAEYRTWAAMLSRCNNPNHRAFRHYGERGIKVCERWSLYENFLADMGRRPSDRHSLDRIDNEGGYSPENCRWATSEQQNNNQRRRRQRTDFGMTFLVAHEGREQTVLDWLHEVKRNPDTYRARRRTGMSVEEAIFTPLLPPGRKPRTRS